MKFKEKQLPGFPVQVCPKNNEHCNVQSLQLSSEKKFLHLQWLEEKGRHRRKYKEFVEPYGKHGSVGKSVTDFAPISRKSVTDLGKSVTDFKEICPRVWGNLPPILRKSVTDFGEIRHRLWENLSPTLGNLSPTLGKPATDFGKLRFQEKSPFLEKFIGKNIFRFWEKHASFLAKTCSVFGEHMPHFWEEQAPSLGQSGPVLVKNRLGLGEIGSLLGLVRGSSLTVLNTKHVLVWIFLSFYDWVSLKKSTGGKLGG